MVHMGHRALIKHRGFDISKWYEKHWKNKTKQNNITQLQHSAQNIKKQLEELLVLGCVDSSLHAGSFCPRGNLPILIAPLVTSSLKTYVPISQLKNRTTQMLHVCLPDELECLCCR